MLLRRVIEHVKTQSWLAVGIDFFIVVIGVFMGLQAQEWNAQRKDRALEQRYLERLHEEVDDSIGRNAPGLERALELLRSLRELTAHFNGAETQSTLGDIHCEAVIASHVYADTVLSLPAIDELSATGRIVLLSNDELRSKLLGYSQYVAASSQLLTDIQVDRLPMARAYPELIALNLDIDSRAAHHCDFEQMRTNRAFKNDLVDNAYRYRAYVLGILQRQQELRREIHDILDRELGVAHAKEPAD